jgi:hypothetical protein
MATNMESLLVEFSFGTVHFVVQEALKGYTHACSVSDVENLMRSLPEEDLKGISQIVFHQPTHKEEISSPRWAAYYPEYSYRSVTGPAILLEALNLSKPLKWKTSLTPEDQKELALLESEGHKITRRKNGILISVDASSVRRTQLERSFIHELGHHVDYKKDPVNFSKKSKRLKEDFANKYYNHLKSSRAIYREGK